MPSWQRVFEGRDERVGDQPVRVASAESIDDGAIRDATVRRYRAGRAPMLNATGARSSLTRPRTSGHAGGGEAA
jgi:hypothetical protein